MPGTPSTLYAIPTMAGGDAINQIDEYTVALGDRIDTVVSAVPQQAWQTIVLTGFSAGNLQYYKDSIGIVHFKGYGLTSASPSAGSTLCTLPAGYRPVSTVYFPIFLLTTGSTLSIISITSAGVMSNLAALGNATWGFGCVSYRAEN